VLFLEQFALKLLKPNTHIHFVGIGGISMSGLAEILKTNHFLVSGSDVRESSTIEKLRKLGINIYIGHSKENIKGDDVIVYTAAVKSTNPELAAAREANLPVIERAVLLGEIMKEYQYPIAVAGTHGKTTTTSMISMILLHANMDPTILVGGELDAIGGNVHTGSHKYLVTEACEYVESFLKFYPYIGVILNVEADHLDYFKNLNHIVHSFQKFAQLVPPEGYIVVCGDDPNALKAVDSVQCNVITYGIREGSYDWKAENISYDISGYPCFDLIYKGKKLSNVQLHVPGIHNVYNALAAVASTYALGISVSDIENGLSLFKGTHRRFEMKGELNGFTIIDDYAHHPTEIMATLAAASKLNHNKIWCIFQPHTYSRTLALLDEFSQAFDNADKVIVTDIYAARETDDGRIHSKDLVNKINERQHKAEYMSSFDDIAAYIVAQASPGDIVITMGAGNVNEIGEKILRHSKQESGSYNMELLKMQSHAIHI